MIELEHYKPDQKRPGYLKFHKTADVDEVLEQAIQALKSAGLWTRLEYFDRVGTGPSGCWPRARWVGCFPVVGGSEGHYIHVEAIALLDRNNHQTTECRLMLIGKTLVGLEHAIEVSAAITRAFYGRGTNAE